MVDTVFYAEMAETALELIRDFGREDLVLSRQAGATSYDPIADTEVTGEAMSQSIHCIVLPYSKSEDNSRGSGTLIDSKKRLFKIAAADLVFEPNAGDTVELDGLTWTALGATPMSPAGIPLVYNVTFQQGE